MELLNIEWLERDQPSKVLGEGRREEVEAVATSGYEVTSKPRMLSWLWLIDRVVKMVIDGLAKVVIEGRGLMLSESEMANQKAKMYGLS